MGNRDLYAAIAATAAVLAATTSAGLAGEPAAIVTEVEAGSPAVGELDLLARDLVVTLANGERIVLGYLASCVRETLAGPGRARVGERQSVLDGAVLVDRRTVDCQGTAVEGTGSGNGAATRLRSLGRPAPAVAAGEQQLGLEPAALLPALRALRRAPAAVGTAPHRSPALLLPDTAVDVTLEPLDRQGKPRRLAAAAGLLVDTLGRTPPLEPGLWRVRRGSLDLRFAVPADAGTASRPARERLLGY
jgi:hypothetical protein